MQKKDCVEGLCEQVEGRRCFGVLIGEVILAKWWCVFLIYVVFLLQYFLILLMSVVVLEDFVVDVGFVETN